MKYLRLILGLLLALGLNGCIQPTAPTTVASANYRVIPVPSPTATDRIRITADHADWTYPLGAPATYAVRIIADPYPAAGIPITYRLGPEQFEGLEHAAIVPAEGLTISAGTRHEPGFTRLIVSAKLEGKTSQALCTLGFAPDGIRPTQTEPADFDAFWDRQKADLAKVPAEPELMPMPGLSTPEVEVFHWSIQNVGNWEGPSRMYGILAVPRGPGPYPALLQVPGAGVRPYKGQVALAAKGVITLEIGIHGLPVNLAPEVYSALSRAGLENYPLTALDQRDNYFYRRVYLGCLRANDYLTNHPKWDRKTLLVGGFSQGGMLSIVTAALDSRVTALAVSFPAYCDVTGYLHGRAGGWPGLFRADRSGKRQVLAPDDPRLRTTAYYDTVNFARRLQVPGHYSFGYNDDVCPPTSMFAAYNSITAPKELVISPEQGHHLSKPQLMDRSGWLDVHLGLK